MEPVIPDRAPVSDHPAKKVLKMGVRVGVGAAVLIYLVAKQDSDRIFGALGDARPLWLASAFGAILVGLFVSALRWRVYLRALDLDLPLGALFRLYFVGTFFNAFLPTGIGGDAYKAIRVGRRRGPVKSLSPAFASVFLDRFAGVVALSLLGFGSSLSLLATGDRHAATYLALVLAGGIVVAAAVILLGGDRLAGIFIPDRGFFARIRRLVRSIELGGTMRETLGPGLGYGLTFQLVVLGYHLAIAKAVGISLGVAQASAIVVISSLATMIPLSINGLGFRETAYTWALAQFAIPDPAQRLAFAILVLGVLLSSSAVGGVVYVVAGGEIDRKSALVESRPTQGET